MAYNKKIAGITIKLDGDTSELVKALDGVSSKADKLSQKFESVGGSLTKKLTVPIVTAGGVAVAKFAEVDKTMMLTNQTMGNTAKEADILNQAMQDAAGNSVYTMDEAATATLNFARAGLDATEAANALAPAMNLAAGEGGDLDIVSGGLVATLNGFGDSFSNAEKYADVFANACNNSALDVNSLSSAMSTAAPIFSAAGYTVQDASLYMGVMANAGIEAGEAANSLKTGLARLISPAKEGSEWMEKLGLSVTNSDGTMKDTVTIQKELHDAFGTLSESEQIAAASAIFGKNQMSKWLALINTAPSEVEDLNEKLSAQGTALSMSEAMMGGFGGSIEKLKSTIDVLMTSMGELIGKYLTPVIEKIQTVIDYLNGLDDETKDRIIKIAGIVAAIGPVILIIGKVIGVISTVTTVISGVSTAMTLLSGPVGLVVLAIGALIAIGVAVYKNWDKIKEAAGKLGDWISEKWTALKEKASKIWGNIKESVANSIGGKAIKAIWDAGSKVMKENWDHMKQAYEENGGGLKGIAAAAMTGIKDAFTSGYRFLDNLTGGKLSEIGDKIKGGLDAWKDNMKQGWSTMKTVTSNAWNTIKGKVEENGGGLTGIIKTNMQTAKDAFKLAFNKMDQISGGKLTKIKNAAKTAFGSMGTNIKTKFDKIKETVGGAFDFIKEKVGGVIDWIKQLFSGELSFPHIKVPHFHIEGGQVPWGIGGKGTPPVISIDWYKKAMDDAYMLNGATIFGARGNSLLGGGESGSEMIIGTNKLMQMIAQAKGGQEVTLNNQFVINGSDKNPRELAHEISYYLDMELKRTAGAFA